MGGASFASYVARARRACRGAQREERDVVEGCLAVSMQSEETGADTQQTMLLYLIPKTTTVKEQEANDWPFAVLLLTLTPGSHDRPKREVAAHD